MDKVPFDNVIRNEFYRLAIVTPEEKEIIRTRCDAGWSQVKQCHAFNMSLQTKGEPPAGMLALYEFLHKREIERAEKIVGLQGRFRK